MRDPTEVRNRCAKPWQVSGRRRGSGWGTRTGLVSFCLQVGSELSEWDLWAGGGGGGCSPSSSAAQVSFGPCLHPPCRHHQRGACQSPSQAVWSSQCPGQPVALPLLRWPLARKQAHQRPSEPRATQHCCWQITVPGRRSHLESTGMGFPGGAVAGNPPADSGDAGSSPCPGGSRMLRSDYTRAP